MSSKEHPMRFVLAFLDFVNEYGIYDEFDVENGTMTTSDEMEALIEFAQTIAPENIGNRTAAQRMRDLTDSERDFLIEEDPAVVIDLRAVFAKKIAQNGGAHGILEQLVAARQRGDTVEVKRLMELAEDFVEGPQEVEKV